MPWSDQTGKVMKKPEEYSKNPNTIRARKRKAGLTPYRREVEQAKASDSKAVTRAWKLRVETDVYKMANAEERKNILENAENEVLERRRIKGYDANSKINRFLLRAGRPIPPGTPPATAPAGPSNLSSGFDLSMNNTQISGYAMQPMAAMHPPGYGAQVGHRFATPSPVYAQVFPSIEASQAFTEAPLSQEHHVNGSHSRISLFSPMDPHVYNHHGGNGNDMSFGRLQLDSAAEAMTRANLMSEVKQQQDRIVELEQTLQHVTNDLVVTKVSLRAQEDRIKDLDTRMQLYDGTALGLNGAEAEFLKQAKKLRVVLSGIQKITEVAAEVYSTLAEADAAKGMNGSGANGVVDGGVNGVNGLNGLNGVNGINGINGVADGDTNGPMNGRRDDEMGEPDEGHTRLLHGTIDLASTVQGVLAATWGEKRKQGPVGFRSLKIITNIVIVASARR
ncbi:hypothetical protein BJ170DRAFT_593906 [Xylariales sp. AK1849]|nr:hypothetical protein BJ170DRAFT_593906 [Xylariales sp. AK1849]